MHVLAIIGVGFLAASAIFTWLIFYLISTGKKQLASRTARFTEQITQAGLALDPVKLCGDYAGRQYKFQFANDDGLVLRVYLTVKNRQHGQLGIHPNKGMGGFPALATGIKDKRVLTGDEAFDRAYITTSIPTSFGNMLICANPLLREQIMKDHRPLSIVLSENTLSLFVNDERHLDAAQWRDYFTLLDGLASAIEA